MAIKQDNFTLAKAAPIPSDAPVTKAQALLLLPLPPYALKSKASDFDGKSVKLSQLANFNRKMKRKAEGMAVRISEKTVIAASLGLCDVIV